MIGRLFHLLTFQNPLWIRHLNKQVSFNWTVFCFFPPMFLNLFKKSQTFSFFPPSSPFTSSSSHCHVLPMFASSWSFFSSLCSFQNLHVNKAHALQIQKTEHVSDWYSFLPIKCCFLVQFLIKGFEKRAQCMLSLIVIACLQVFVS